MRAFLLTTLVAFPALGQTHIPCEWRAWRTLLGAPSGFPATANSIEEALASGGFADRFATFINARFNKTQGATHGQQAPYWLAAFVLSNGLQWKELFVGHWVVPDHDYPQVTADPNGIGFFTSPGWMARYAGNEKNGLTLVMANRILQNTIGLQRVAAANNSAPGVQNDAQGRQAAGCRGCHFDGPYALDDVAQVLPRKVVDAQGNVSFAPAPGTPSPTLGAMLSSERELVERLVDSDAFKFWTCRLAFEFVYGRDEYACDAPTFDRCVDAFTQTGLMQTAVQTVLTDPNYCR